MTHLNLLNLAKEVDLKHKHDLSEPVLEIIKSLLKLGSSFVFVGAFLEEYNY